MTAVHLNDAELPEAAKYGSHWHLDLLDNAETSVSVTTIGQAKALNSAAQKILREMRQDAKAAANLARQQVNGARPEFRADLLDEPGPVVDSEAWTCARCGGQMIGDRTPDDLCRQCIALALDGQEPQDPAPPHAAYSAPDHLCHTWPQAPAELDNVGGRGGFAGYQTVPTFHCTDCGGHGTMPAYRRDCPRYGVAQLHGTPVAATAREYLADYEARVDARTIYQDDASGDDSPYYQLGKLSGALGRLLAEIDDRAGAAR